MKEETPEENSDRMDREIAAVVDIMKQEWPDCVDYNMREDDAVEILDAQGQVITTITNERLDEFWNLSEGALIIQTIKQTFTVFPINEETAD